MHICETLTRVQYHRNLPGVIRNRDLAVRLERLRVRRELAARDYIDFLAVQAHEVVEIVLKSDHGPWLLLGRLRQDLRQKERLRILLERGRP